MTGNTHLAIGCASGVAVVYLTQDTSWLHIGLTIFLAGAAALLPDIDVEGSQISRILFPADVSKQVRSFALASIGLLLSLLYLFVPNIPLWVLLTGIFVFAVSFAPHRTLTHSIVMCVYIGWIIQLALPELATAVIVGYVSHIVADMLTKSGVPLFWPIPWNISISQIGINITTGDWVDSALGYLCMALTIVGVVYLFL